MFGTNKPVTADAFFDREDILQRLSDAVRQLQAGSPKWLALIGVRRIGKTSLLLELARREHRQERLTFVVLDLLEETPLSPEVFRWYAARVVEALLGHEVGTSLSLMVGRPADFRRALQRAPSFTKLSEATRVSLNELPDAKVDAGFVRAALSLPERLATELDLRVLVAIDEFQELAQLAGAGPVVRSFRCRSSVMRRSVPSPSTWPNSASTSFTNRVRPAVRSIC
ncbi:MAG: hypothetical protein ACOC1F_07420 [Myxococcota bacterium]